MQYRGNNYNHRSKRSIFYLREDVGTTPSAPPAASKIRYSAVRCGVLLNIYGVLIAVIYAK